MIRKRCGSKIYYLELNNHFRCVIENKLKKYFQIALLQYATYSCTFQHDRKPQSKTRTKKCVGILHHIQH